MIFDSNYFFRVSWYLAWFNVVKALISLPSEWSC